MTKSCLRSAHCSYRNGTTCMSRMLLFSDLVDFSDEEGYGKYLDLHECYTKYINLKGVQKIDYITYLTLFDQLFDIPKERKNAAYKE